MNIRYIEGQKFARVLVLKREGSRNGNATYLCRCDCGNEFVTVGRYLRVGNVKSCGCLNREKRIERHTTHGKSKTRLYRIWKSMKYRCFSHNNPAYKNYGGRGITMCDEWLNSYPVFEKWAIANGYNENLTIDRIDVNGDYCPKNCRWVTLQEQANNRRTSHFIEYNGRKQTIAEWGRELNIPQKYIWTRIYKLGWPIEKAFSAKNYNKEK